MTTAHAAASTDARFHWNEPGNACRYMRVKATPTYRRLMDLFRTVREVSQEAEHLARTVRPGTIVGDYLDYPFEFREALTALAFVGRMVESLVSGDLPPDRDDDGKD